MKVKIIQRETFIEFENGWEGIVDIDGKVVIKDKEFGDEVELKVRIDNISKLIEALLEIKDNQGQYL